MDLIISKSIPKPTIDLTRGRPVDVGRALLRHIGDWKVEGTPSEKLNEGIMIAKTSDSAQRKSNHATTAMTHMEIMAIVPHYTALHNDDKIAYAPIQ